MKTITAKSLTMAFVPMLGLAFFPSVLGQQIVPAGDGTGTSVNLGGDRLDIEGGVAVEMGQIFSTVSIALILIPVKLLILFLPQKYKTFSAGLWVEMLR